MAAAAASPPADTEANGLAECAATIEGQVVALPEVLLQARARLWAHALAAATVSRGSYRRFGKG